MFGPSILPSFAIFYLNRLNHPLASFGSVHEWHMWGPDHRHARSLILCKAIFLWEIAMRCQEYIHPKPPHTSPLSILFAHFRSMLFLFSFESTFATRDVPLQWIQCHPMPHLCGGTGCALLCSPQATCASRLFIHSTNNTIESPWISQVADNCTVKLWCDIQGCSLCSLHQNASKRLWCLPVQYIVSFLKNKVRACGHLWSFLAARCQT